MTDDKIKRMLQEADRLAGAVRVGDDIAIKVRLRAKYRHVRNISGAAVAAMVLISFGLWTAMVGQERDGGVKVADAAAEQVRIAKLEKQVDQLQAKNDAMLDLVNEVIERDRRDRRLAKLHAELASIPDPIKEIEKNVDKTAFILIYQADRMYNELNQKESAVKAYQQVIELFPNNQWAEQARKRLSEIKENRLMKKGDLSCRPENLVLS
jgi:TolA-binding protein